LDEQIIKLTFYFFKSQKETRRLEYVSFTIYNVVLYQLSDPSK